MPFNEVISILTLLAPYLVPLISGAVVYSLSKLPLAQQTIVRNVANDVVHAVEQIGAGKSGTEKKMMATNMIVAALKHYGIVADSALISTLIEAYVNQLPQVSSPSVDPTKQNG